MVNYLVLRRNRSQVERIHRNRRARQRAYYSAARAVLLRRLLLLLLLKAIAAAHFHFLLFFLFALSQARSTAACAWCLDGNLVLSISLILGSLGSRAVVVSVCHFSRIGICESRDVDREIVVENELS